MSEILVAKNITKIYGIGTSHSFEALHGVSMTMNEENSSVSWDQVVQVNQLLLIIYLQ